MIKDFCGLVIHSSKFRASVLRHKIDYQTIKIFLLEWLEKDFAQNSTEILTIASAFSSLYPPAINYCVHENIFLSSLHQQWSFTVRGLVPSRMCLCIEDIITYS